MSLVQAVAAKVQGLVRRQAKSLGDDAAKTVRNQAMSLGDDGVKLVRQGSDDAIRKVRAAMAKDQINFSTLAKPTRARRVTLHPRVAAHLPQSRLNAQRYKEETIQVLTEKLGSRAKAEAKYEALLKHFKKKMTIAANYPAPALQGAMEEGAIRSLYDFPLREQIKRKGIRYVLKRHVVDMVLGNHSANPLYVTIGGNKKFAKDIAEYGDVTMRYSKKALEGRVLFSDGNHFVHFFNYPKHKARQVYKQQQFTWFDAPHLLINRVVKENLKPEEASHLIEGVVFGGINPRLAGEAIKPQKTNAAVDALIGLANRLGLRVER